MSIHWGAPFQPPFSDLRSADWPHGSNLTRLYLPPWGAPFQPPFSDPRSRSIYPLGALPSSFHSPIPDLHSLTRSIYPLGALPSSLHSPIPDLHSLTRLYLPPWGASFQPPFSDPRSAFAHSAPLGRSLQTFILRSPICTRSPLYRLQTTVIHLPRLGALPSSLHSPISILRFAANDGGALNGRHPQRCHIEMRL